MSFLPVEPLETGNISVVGRKFGIPVVLISTSGTASANYYPAVIEASLSRVPLFILSADRPGSLVGTGANQTINQENLYGDYVRYFADTGLPEKAFGNLQNLLESGWKHAAGSERKLPPGPVHLNFPFIKLSFSLVVLRRYVALVLYLLLKES